MQIVAMLTKMATGFGLIQKSRTRAGARSRARVSR